MNKPHPIQPVITDNHGNPRFKQNAIVAFLARGRLNEIAAMDFPREDREQLAQLIGYSLSGASELSYFSSDTLKAAEAMHETGLTRQDARIQALEGTIVILRDAIRNAATAAFDIHPDDLTA